VTTNDTGKTLCQVTGHRTRWYVFKYSCLEHTDNHFKDLIAENQETYGSMFVPLIIGSDKTVVSVATGQTEYHPLYLSIGNIHNSVQCAHRGGVVLIVFLAIPKCRYPHLLFVLNYILISFI
jgi:Plavaka transposase